MAPPADPHPTPSPTHTHTHKKNHTTATTRPPFPDHMPDYLLAMLRSMARSMKYQRSTATVSDKAGERLTDQIFEHEHQGRAQEGPGGHGGGAAGSEAGWGEASSEGGVEGEEWGDPPPDADEAQQRSGRAAQPTTQQRPPAVQSLPRRGPQGGTDAANMV